MANVLSAEDVEKFNELGYCGPFQAFSTDEIGALRGRIETFERKHPEGVGKLYQGPHLIFPWLYDLLSRPAMIEPCADLLGPNLLCNSVGFRIKEPGTGTFVGWHQDKFYAPYNPILIVCLLHFTDQTAEHGCLHLVPGSQKWGVLDHEETDNDDNLLTRKQRIRTPFDEMLAVAVPARAGDITLFNHAVIHGSPPNRSKERRINMLADMVPPNSVRPGRREAAVVVRGVDTLNLYDHEERPKDDYGPLSIARHREAIGVRNEMSYAGSKKVSPALL